VFMTGKNPSLQGRVALITGGSGWIGGVIAQHLAASGAKVGVNYYRNAEKAQQIVGDIEQAGGIALALQADILDEHSVQAMVSQVRERFGVVDILVNNALNSTVPWAAIEDQTWEHYLGHLEFCIKAPLLLLKAVLPGMKAQRFGRVINIGSEAFDLGDAKNAHYIASKGAMQGLTRSWANELGAFGITVNTVAPGWIAREGHGYENGQPGATLKGYQLNVPVNRIGTPNDIGATVAFLSSDDAGFITGQKLAVNGGRTLL
jgi:3-oxoacyl-[acyl-carrier protein] reductase